MQLTRRRIIVGCSIVYLAGLTALAGYALHATTAYSLPIANIIPALAVALPPLAGVALETVMTFNQRLAAKGQIQASRMFQLTVTAFLVFEAVLATLAGTHVGPAADLDCGLNGRWEALWHVKDGARVRRIQDTFECCGFKNIKDRAFPFPSASHGVDACALAYDRNTPCLGPWRQEERKVGIMLMVVAIGVFFWKVIILLAPSSQSSWLPSQIRLPGDEDAAGSEPRRTRRPARAAIGYRDVEGDVEEDSLQREVSNLNNDSRLATHVEGNRRRPSMFEEAEQWRESRNE